jgi:hypothetical protein
MAKKNSAFEALLRGLIRHRIMQMELNDAQTMATSMSVLMTYWLSYEYVKNPRQAQESSHAEQSLLNGAFHILNLLSPYLHNDARQHLRLLAQSYVSSVNPY